MAEPVYVAEGSKHTSRLDPSQKDYVLQQLAEGYTHKEVQVRLKTEYGVDLSLHGVQYYSWKERERILQKRRALNDQLDRIPISSKFIRLRMLREQGTRIKDTSFTGKHGEDHKAKEALLLDVSEQQRKEVDGFKSSMGMEAGDPFRVLGVVSVVELNKAIKEAEKPAKEADKQEPESPE